MTKIVYHREIVATGPHFGGILWRGLTWVKTSVGTEIIRNERVKRDSFLEEGP